MRMIEDNDSYAVPIPYVQEVIDFLPHGHVIRVMIQILLYTGCRLKELEKMQMDKLVDNVIYWPLGKNQTAWRKERLPEAVVSEIHTYRKNNRVYQNKIFGINSHSLRRYFNRDVRPRLSSGWHAKRRIPRINGWQTEYVLQLKGLRKTFQTFKYAQEWREWGSAEVAVEFVSKRMGHSSKGITCKHYIENFRSLGIEKESVLDLQTALRSQSQLRIQDYLCE